MTLKLVAHTLYIGGILGGITIAFIMFCFGYTAYIPHILIGGVLVTAWVAAIAIIRRMTCRTKDKNDGTI